MTTISARKFALRSDRMVVRHGSGSMATSTHGFAEMQHLNSIRLGAALLAAVFAIGCDAADTAPNDFDQLVDWMTGSFSSEAQAEADSSYFDIRLEMVRIWHEREDGVWLYVEQADAESLDQPYRQRIYRVLESSGSTFASEVYEMADPLRFAGAWRNPDSFGTLSPDSLTARAGCTVFLRRISESEFSGSTSGTGCESVIRGASYATSEVSVTHDSLTSWDRGFAADGNQVWGAIDGPYVFLKVGRG